MASDHSGSMFVSFQGILFLVIWKSGCLCEPLMERQTLQQREEWERERERPLDPWPIPQASLKLPFLFALLTQRPTSSLSLGSHSFTLLSICLTIRFPLFPFVLFPEPCNASSLNILWLWLCCWCWTKGKRVQYSRQCPFISFNAAPTLVRYWLANGTDEWSLFAIIS